MQKVIFEEKAVSPPLQKYVSQFFTITVAESPENTYSGNLILPDGTAGLIIVEQGSFIRKNANRESARLREAYLFGQKSKSIEYCFGENSLKCFGIKFSAFALKAIFNLPQGEITDRTINLADIASDFPLETFLNLEDTLTRQKLLEDYLLKRTKQAHEGKVRQTELILSYIHSLQEVPPVSAISEYFKLGYKYLERLFKEYVGLSPKMYLRLCRFNKLMAAACKTPQANIYHIALDQGYYDQMHLIRDMKFFTSQTPTKFFGRQTAEVETEHRKFMRENSERLSNFYYT